MWRRKPIKSKTRVRTRPDRATRIMAALAWAAKLRKTPLTADRLLDRLLSEVLPAWNACPPDMPPDQRRWLLAVNDSKGVEAAMGAAGWGNARGVPQRDLSAYAQLKEKFALPFGRNRYAPALDALVKWQTLICLIRTTEQHHAEQVFLNLAFREWDNQTGRVSAWRVAKELRITHPGLLENASPKAKEIHTLLSRYLDYKASHEDTQQRLMELLCPPELRSAPLRFDERALGVPQPPEDMPRHLYIARLAALGICTADRLQAFLGDDFLGRPAQEKQEKQDFVPILDAINRDLGAFLAEYREPYTPTQRVAIARAWVVDNGPIFRAFDWSTREI